ncbi:MAG: hypothetical protein GPJ13_17565 [Microcystis aeruginosa W11-06]|nr:hypothetical protein [Microcystis aeruginosa W11-03]NCR95473.1 hypothetical protein [Microcystis aeruginosa W11-06]
MSESYLISYQEPVVRSRSSGVSSQEIAFIILPSPHTLHPTPYTLHPTPYTPHPTPHTLHPTPHTLHPKP